MDHITDASYKHAKRFCKGFKVMNLGDFHDSSISIEVSKTVFVLYFFYEKIISI